MLFNQSIVNGKANNGNEDEISTVHTDEENISKSVGTEDRKSTSICQPKAERETFDDEEKKKAERRAANRRSAFQSRQRRRLLIEDLQKSVGKISKDNIDLQNSNNQLRVKLQTKLLENELLRKHQLPNTNRGATLPGKAQQYVLGAQQVIVPQTNFAAPVPQLVVAGANTDSTVNNSSYLSAAGLLGAANQFPTISQRSPGKTNLVSSIQNPVTATSTGDLQKQVAMIFSGSTDSRKQVPTNDMQVLNQQPQLSQSLVSQPVPTVTTNDQSLAQALTVLVKSINASSQILPLKTANS